MSNYLIRQGQAWSVKVPIPRDVQPVFGKRAFKKSLKTSDKSVAISRSGPLILQYKNKIEEARGNPTQSLDEFLQAAQATIGQARKASGVDEDSIAGIQDEVLDRLTRAYGVQYPEQLNQKAEAEVIRAYKIVDGQLTPFDGPLGTYAASRKVEVKTAEKDRHAISKFATRVGAIQQVDRTAVRDFVTHLSVEEGLKNRTIKDNLSTLKVYWHWLQHHSLASEDAPNPFADVPLPAENRKDAAEKVRLPFTIEHIKTLDEGITASNDEMLQAIFKLALYTGCRIEELAKLEAINVTPDTIEITRAKSPAGNRSIPVHDKLRPLVSDMLSRNDEYLLPDLRENRLGVRSSLMSKKFGKLKSRLGFDRRYVFHCIRKTVATQFEQAGISEGVAADVLGHDKPTMTYGVYAGGSSVEQKRAAIMKLDYGID